MRAMAIMRLIRVNSLNQYKIVGTNEAAILVQYQGCVCVVLDRALTLGFCLVSRLALGFFRFGHSTLTEISSMPSTKRLTFSIF